MLLCLPHLADSLVLTAALRAETPAQADKGPPSADRPEDRALASVGEKVITLGDFTEETGRTRVDLSSEGQKEGLLERLIRFELLCAEALKRGYDKDPEIMAGLRRMMAGKLRQEELEPRLEKLSVTEEEIQRYYLEHPDEFVTPKAVRAAVIEIRVPARASSEKRAELARRAEEARAEALRLGPATLSFGSVAVKYSEDQATRYRGGDTGLLKAGQRGYPWGKEVMEAIFSLAAPGEVSPVISAPGGFYIAKLMEVRETSRRPREEVKDLIGRRLQGEKRAEVEKEFFEGLARRFPVKVDRALLESITVEKKEGQEADRSPPPLPAP